MGAHGKTVVISIEGKSSQALLHWYLSNFHRQEDRIVMVHADDSQEDMWLMLATGRAAMSAGDSKSTSLFRDTSCCKLQKNCLSTLRKWKANGTFYCRKGRLRDAVVTAAKEEGASLVVMADHHHGRLYRALLGTSQDYVVRHTGLPVKTYCTEQAKQFWTSEKIL